ncbi:glycosyltransferase [Halobacillus sp. H74]|uniref:glycosyltransferase n=1 Tax=Halobacillus sp. H74 TaxID=3457436 RepID=UPI003FCD4F74
MKKIMFVIGVLSNGGAERVVSILAKQLCDMGYEVNIITIYGNKNDYLLDDRVNIHSLDHSSKNKIIRIFEIIYKTRKIIKKINPNIIISFVAIINIYTILSNLLLKNRLIVSERNDPYQNPENKYLRIIRDILYKFADGFVFQTKDAKNYFVQPIQHLGTIIPNPINTSLPYWNESKKSHTIITACRLSKQKNLPMLIEAFEEIKKKYPNYKLKIFGVGELREDLLRIIGQKGLENDVFLPGFSKNIHVEMVNSSLFVIPSNYEGISNSMLEALAIGVPVISTDSPIGGAKMFIRDGENGMLIKVGDTWGLVSAMDKIISDKKYALDLSYESRKIRNEISQEVVAKMWIGYIHKVYGGKNGVSSNVKE